ncbi:stAR-related lipid transfer protein 5 [Strongylocentrotus purpuratus]|uniref:START domain-containing protein n=1 Tax=Strongylocentrotus purpuratus TaxID=7668 RepID=A0A7M7LTN9_STRPU|nr:stAR-related lipid transfer protein 5 [Strongylocentrotus purpuratus]
MSAGAGALTGLCAATVGIVQHQRRGTDQTSESSSPQHSKANPHSPPRSSGDKTRGSGISAAPSGEGKETSGGPAMDFNEYADDVANRALDLYNDNDWKVARSAEEISFEDFKKEIKIMYKKSSEFDGHVYRAECTIDAPPEKIIHYILPSPKGLRGKWDKNVKESDVIENINENLIIARSATHSAAMGLIASRDFVDLITVRRYPDRGIVATSSRSVDRKDRPPVDGFVRGVNYHGGTFCSPVDGESNKTRVVNIVQTDLCGMIPQSLVESALPNNLIEFFVDLDNSLKKDY